MNNEKTVDMAVLVISFDGYSTLWDPFFKLMRKNWPNCNMKVYLVTNVKNPKIEGVNIITTGNNNSWSQRVRIALDQITEEYICFFLDDFFIADIVDNKGVEELYFQARKYDLSYIKCFYTETGKERKIGRNSIRYKDTSNLYCLRKNERYGISLGVGIWKRKYFRKLIGEKDYNPWKFEVDRIHEAQNETDEFFEDVAVEYRNLFGIWNGVIQGKYVLSTYRHIKNEGITLDESVIKKMDILTCLRLKMKRIGMKIVPLKFYPIIKKIAKKFGFTFVTDDNE